jgi:hypothetical protein
MFFQKHKNTFPIPSMIHYSVLFFLFITISIFPIDKIQYHVSRFEHQIILGILANPLILQSRPIYLQIFLFTKIANA